VISALQFNAAEQNDMGATTTTSNNKVRKGLDDAENSERRIIVVDVIVLQ
jgi:hypothetical protein